MGSENCDLKGGHPPAVKVGGMRVVQHKRQSESEKAPEEKSTEESETVVEDEKTKLKPNQHQRRKLLRHTKKLARISLNKLFPRSQPQLRTSMLMQNLITNRFSNQEKIELNDKDTWSQEYVVLSFSIQFLKLNQFLLKLASKKEIFISL